MNWRKQAQEHLRDAREQVEWLATHVSSDSNEVRGIPNPAQKLPGHDLGACFDLIEQRVRNARRLIEA